MRELNYERLVFKDRLSDIVKIADVRHVLNISPGTERIRRGSQGLVEFGVLYEMNADRRTILRNTYAYYNWFEDAGGIYASLGLLFAGIHAFFQPNAA